MVEVVIGRKIPQHWLALNEYVVAEEQIVSFLSLFIKERIIIVALETFHHVSRMTCPLIDFPICFHRIYQMGAAILYGDGIAMIVVPGTFVRSIHLIVLREWPSLHMGEQIDSICIVINRRVADNT